MKSEFYIESEPNSVTTTLPQSHCRPIINHQSFQLLSIGHHHKSKPTNSSKKKVNYNACQSQRLSKQQQKSNYLKKQGKMITAKIDEVTNKLQRIASQNTVKHKKRLKSNRSKFLLQINEHDQIIQMNACKQCLKFQDKLRQNESIRHGLQESSSEMKQKYISMEKRYLLKEQEYIKLAAQFQNITKQLSSSNESLIVYKKEIDGKSLVITSQQKQLIDLVQKNKIQENNIASAYNYILQFISLSDKILKWSELFERTADKELPATVFMIKQQLQLRKEDIQAQFITALSFCERLFVLHEGKLEKQSNQEEKLSRDEEMKKIMDSMIKFPSKSVRNNQSFLKLMRQQLSKAKTKKSALKGSYQTKQWQLLSEFNSNASNKNNKNKENIVNKENINTLNIQSCSQKDQFQHYIASGNKILKKKLFNEKQNQLHQSCLQSWQKQKTFLQESDFNHEIRENDSQVLSGEPFYRILLTQAKFIEEFSNYEDSNNCIKIHQKDYCSKIYDFPTNQTSRLITNLQSYT